MTATLPTHPQKVPGGSAVDAVLVVHDGAPWLPGCLAAVAAQSHPVRDLVVVLTGVDDAVPADLIQQVSAAVGEVTVLEARGASQPLAVARALDALQGRHGRPTASDVQTLPGAAGAGSADTSSPSPTARWVWLLEDDCAPEPSCLQALLREATLSATVAIAGPKHVDAARPDRLVEVGRTVSRAGRRVASPLPGELDQGQHDGRSDVLAVSTGAMLVRADALDALHGLDPALPVGADLDLCWRAHLAGLRVVVVPTARVRDARASANGLRSRERMPFAGLSLEEIDDQTFSRRRVMQERRAWERERRRAAASARRRDRRAGRTVALARCPLWQAPLVALQVLLGALLLAPLLLVLKRPQAALDEVSDVLAVLTPWRWLGAVRRGGTAGGRGSVGGLLASESRALRGVGDEIYRGLPPAPHAAAATAPAEPGPVSEDALGLPGEDPGSRVARHPAVLAVLLATLATAAAWWPVLRGSGWSRVRDGGVVGGEMLRASGQAASAWTAWLTGWRPAGEGVVAEGPAWLPLVAAPAWLVEHLPGREPASSIGVAGALVLLVAIPLATLSAYASARAVTTRPWPRALAALAWALSPAVLVGVREGRLGAAVLAVALPVLLGATGVAARPRPWWPAVGLAALAGAVCASVAPVLLILPLAAGLLVTAVQRGRSRLAGPVLALAPVLLLGPAVRGWWQDPLTLLTGPGLAQWGTPARPWLAATLWPLDPSQGAVPGPAWVGDVLPYVAVPVVLAGLAGLAVGGRRGVAAGALGTTALVALAAAAWAPHLTIAQSSGPGGLAHDVTVWTGGPLLLLTACLLAAALLGVESVRRPGRGRSVRVAAVAGTALVCLTVLAQALWLGATGLDGVLVARRADQPAAVRDAASSGLAARHLLLRPEGAVVRHELLPADPTRLARELPAGSGEAAAVTDLTRALLEGPEGDDAGAVVTRLARAGIGFVGIDPADPVVAARLDATAGLVRLTGTDGPPVWRVVPRSPSGAAVAVPVSLVQALDQDGTPVGAIPVRGPGPRVDAELPEGARVLAVAQSPEWGRTVTTQVDGRDMTMRERDGLATYDLPPGARRVTVEPRLAHPAWSWVQAAALVLTVLLALPFGVRHRAGTEEER